MWFEPSDTAGYQASRTGGVAAEGQRVVGALQPGAYTQNSILSHYFFARRYSYLLPVGVAF
jgi:hypothetical protein